MKSYYPWIVAIFLILSWTEINQKRKSFSRFFIPQSAVLPQHYQTLIQSPISKSSAALLHALVTGETRKIDKQHLKIYKSMGLMHLLTPSGLHLSFIAWFRKWVHPVAYLLILSLLAFKIFPLAGYFPIKRMLMFKGMQGLVKLSSIKLFSLTFILDLAFGHYQSSPFSSLLSFLFWGTIITHRKYLETSLYSKLCLNSVLVNLIFQQSTALMSFLINPILSLLIGLLFPFIFLTYFLIPVTLIPAEIFCWGLSWMHQLVLNSYGLIWALPVNSFSLVLVWSIFARKKKVLIFALIFYSGVLGEDFKSKIQSGKWLRPPESIQRPGSII